MRFGTHNFRALAMTLSNDSVRPEGQHEPAKAFQKPLPAWPLFFAAAAKRLSLAAFTCVLALIILASLSASSAVAQDKKGGGDLGTQATNPAAALIQLQLQDQFVPSTQDADGYANTGIIQPAIHSL